MSTSPDSRRQEALQVLRQLEPGAVKSVVDNFDELSPDLLEVVLGFAFADVLARPGLDLRTREMLTIGALAAMASAPNQLEFHIRAALNVGVSQQEVVEILLQMCVYAGVPAFVNAMKAAKRAFQTQAQNS